MITKSTSRGISVLLTMLSLALTFGCSSQAEKDTKARWAASYTSQCNKAVANQGGLARYSFTFCSCVAERTVRTFSAIQLFLAPISKPLRDAGNAITHECSLIASMQEEYNRLIAAARAHNDLAVTAYLTPDFVGTDASGRSKNARQMLSGIDSRANGGFEITTVRSARTSGKRILVDLKSLKGTETIVGGKTRVIETNSFFSDTWIDSDGAWLLQRSRLYKLDTYVDGTRVSQRRPGDSLDTPWF